MTPTTTAAAIEKPRLGFWQIWNMNFGFLGIQFGLALQNANASRIFETLGAQCRRNSHSVAGRSHHWSTRSAAHWLLQRPHLASDAGSAASVFLLVGAFWPAWPCS